MRAGAGVVQRASGSRLALATQPTPRERCLQQSGGSLSAPSAVGRSAPSAPLRQNVCDLEDAGRKASPCRQHYRMRTTTGGEETRQTPALRFPAAAGRAAPEILGPPRPRPSAAAAHLAGWRGCAFSLAGATTQGDRFRTHRPAGNVDLRRCGRAACCPKSARRRFQLRSILELAYRGCGAA